MFSDSGPSMERILLNGDSSRRDYPSQLLHVHSDKLLAAYITAVETTIHRSFLFGWIVIIR